MIPKLSIITINRNNAEGLLHTIISVASQSMTNYEYIIIDGASNDDSVEIIKRNEGSITYWISENDNGIYNAMNKGIYRASGTYCLFLNSGDTFYDNSALENVFNNNPIEDIVYANLQIKGKDRNRRYVFPSKMNFYWLYTEFLGHPSTLIKRNLFEKIGGYNENHKIVSDWEFFILAFAKYGASYRYVNITLATIYEGGISNNNSFKHIVESERNSVLNEYFSLFIDDYKELYNFKFNSIIKKLRRFVKKILLIR